MNAHSGIPYRPLTGDPGDPPGIPSTTSSMTGLGVTASKHTWPHALQICPDGIMRYHHGVPDLQRPLCEDSHYYPSSYVEQESHRMLPFGVAHSAVPVCHSPSCFTPAPYVPSYHLLYRTPPERWQSIGAFHPPTPLFGQHTPTMFSPSNVDSISPVELESQASQRSFASSWRNCPTPQAVLQSHHSLTPEVETALESAQYPARDLVPESQSPKKRRPGKRVFKCDICNKTFERNSNLKYHRTTHEDARESLACDKIGCLRTFNRRADMSRHIRTAHEKTAKFSCPRCDRDFGRSDTLKRHMRNTCQRTELSYRTPEPEELS